MRRLAQWFDSRTGVYDVIQHALYENIPSGARWRYITGSMLVFAFVVQAITGIFLWMAYSPSSQTAYESVYYIQHEMTGGWLLRGVHHFMAQAMVVVMGLHLTQVIVDGAYRAPREFNYWLGLILMQLVMGLGLTGYLLPWDQKGYWATNVATNLMTLVPFVGKELQQIAVGGNEYGHHTLTRFFAMHTGVLPAALIGFLVLHIAAFRKHGIMAKITPGKPDQYFWPHQVLLDAVGCLVLLGVVLLCVIHFDVTGLVSGNLPEVHQGAELGAPADPSEAYSAARPEWYYLFLFQLLKYFHGTQEIIGALIIPGIVMTILVLAPIVGRWNLGHAFNVGYLLFLIAAVGVLTTAAFLEDGNNYEFQEAKRDAAKNAERMVELVNRREWEIADGKGRLSDRRMFDKGGGIALVRNDPLLRGPKLFAQHCASCHSYIDPKNPEQSFVLKQSPHSKPQPDPHDKERVVPIVERNPKGELIYDSIPIGSGAPNLYGFASREWLRGFLNPDKIAAPPVPGEPTAAKNPTIASIGDHAENHNRPLLGADYFGNTNHREGRMVKWVQGHIQLKPKAGGKKKEGELDAADVAAIAAALSAQARLRTQQAADAKDETLITKGITLIEQNCAKGCHKFGDHGELGLAPDLTGYGSYEWMMGMISDPTHRRFYRQENDRMPSFAADLDKPASHSVSIRELSLIVDWLRGEYYLPDDEQPVLPHKEEVAKATVIAARPDFDARPKIVGAPTPKAEANTARAERLFRQNCAACHSHSSGGEGIKARNSSAPNLHGFASREWLAGLLDPAKVAEDQYFGKTSHHAGEMAGFVDSDLKDPDAAKKEKIAQIVAALSAEAALPAQAEADKKATDDGTIAQGKAAMAEMFSTSACTDCHKFGDGGGSGPDLTGYGSKDWLTRFISDPSHESLYAKGNDRMPSFAAAGPGPKKPLLTKDEIDLVARWLRGEKLK